MNFVVTANHRVKIKDNKKIDKYLNLARELKKLWKMRVTMIPTVIGVLATVLKGLERGLEELGIEERAETIQITALLRSVKILNPESWQPEETCYHLYSKERPSANTSEKNSPTLK